MKSLDNPSEMIGRIFAMYKPLHWTSHDVVNYLRRLTGERRIGHAGTLDPLATGVLVVAVGREATKRLEAEVKKEKEYVAEITLGQTSSTEDSEGDKTTHEVKNIPAQELVQKIVEQFVGEIQQTPSIYSAVKIHGKEAYKYARKGQTVVLGPRNVFIKSIEVIEYSWPVVRVRVITGAGVYIRSLARDIGEALSTGGYMSALVRERVGDFTLNDSYEISETSHS
jgi:tRNA pseudouridine55 synthase